LRRTDACFSKFDVSQCRLPVLTLGNYRMRFFEQECMLADVGDMLDEILCERAALVSTEAGVMHQSDVVGCKCVTFFRGLTEVIIRFAK
jgi:hypothetical protein